MRTNEANEGSRIENLYEESNHKYNFDPYDFLYNDQDELNDRLHPSNWHSDLDYIDQLF